MCSRFFDLSTTPCMDNIFSSMMVFNPSPLSLFIGQEGGTCADGVGTTILSGTGGGVVCGIQILNRSFNLLESISSFGIELAHHPQPQKCQSWALGYHSRFLKW